MKSVLASIQPRWCEKIACGDKTDEIRKNAPKIPVPFKCYIYQTNMMWSYPILRYLGRLDLLEKLDRGKGKVIGEFLCDAINPVTVDNEKRLAKTSCVTLREMWEYAKPKSLFDLKSWHISGLTMYENPKPLSMFHKVGYISTKQSVFGWTMEEEKSWQINKPPQSWCYVEEEQYGSLE